MKKFLAILLVLCCTAVSALAQTAITLPIAANAVADIGNGPIKVRLVSGNASVFTSQSSGVGSTAGPSTTLTLTATPATPPIVGGLISGAGITPGTTIAAYNGTTGITLSAAMTVAASTPVAWGAACPSSPPGNVILASVSAGYYIMYTQARVCAISPGGPVNTLLIEPIFYSTPGNAVVPISGIANSPCLAGDSNGNIIPNTTPGCVAPPPAPQTVQFALGGTVAAQDCTLPVRVPLSGAKPNDIVLLGMAPTFPYSMKAYGQVVVPGMVDVWMCNSTAFPINVTSGPVRATVL